MNTQVQLTIKAVSSIHFFAKFLTGIKLLLLKNIFCPPKWSGMYKLQTFSEVFAASLQRYKLSYYNFC